MAADTAKLAIQLSNWASQGDWRLYFLYRDRIEKVSPEDVTRVASTYLIRSNRTSGMFIPTEKPDRVTIPPAPPEADLFADFHPREATSEGRVVRPDAGEYRRPQPADLAGQGNQGSAAAQKDARPDGPFAARPAVWNQGEPEALSGGDGVAARADDPRHEGADACRVARPARQEPGHAHVPTETREWPRSTIETKRHNLPVVLDLLRQILREPTLPDEEWGEMQRESLANLDEQLTDPQSLALVRMRRTINPYSKDDVRYIPTPQEEIEDVSALKAADFQKLYGDFLGSQAGELAMIGDFDPDEVRPLLEKIFEGWKAKQPYQRIEQIVFDKVTGGRQQILTPDKANAIYVAGETFALRDSDPDYAPLVLGNFIFGGGALSSRLGDRVRQKEGLSYGVGSNVRRPTRSIAAAA